MKPDLPNTANAAATAVTTARPRPSKPMPSPSDANRPFWAGCAAGELRLKCCKACGRHQAPTRAACHCGGLAFDWVTVSGKATLFSYTVLHRAPDPAFKDELPYVVAIVEFDDADGGVLSDHDIVADGEDVPPAVREINTAMNVHAFADGGAERAQHRRVKHRALQRAPRNQARGRDDDPVTDVEGRPDGRSHRAIASDDKPLDYNREGHGQGRVEHHTNKCEGRQHDYRSRQAEMAREPRQQHEGDRIRDRRRGDVTDEQPQRLNQRRRQRTHYGRRLA
mgnify:CR=1 FL=1